MFKWQILYLKFLNQPRILAGTTQFAKVLNGVNTVAMRFPDQNRNDSEA